MADTMFADESGTSDGLSCFSIGCILIPTERLKNIEDEITDLLGKHNIPSNELKWEGIRNCHGRINVQMDVIKLVMS